MEISLKKFQDDFVFSKKRYPSFYGGWAVGKSLCLILRAMLYSELIPNNLGIIFRREYTDLRDSTVKDFEKYTNLKVNSGREVILPNKSAILFRHIEELHNIQNVNLGWFAIEQADELDSDNEFFLLFGRLRRAVEPTEQFKALGMPERSGFVIGNAGDHWGKRVWKESTLDDGEIIEATTYENEDVLPKDFMISLETLKTKKPEIYSRFVMNDWNISSDKFVLIKPAMLELLKNISHHVIKDKYVISCDPSAGGDECVIYVLENTKKIDELILHYDDTMKIVGELMILSERHGIDDIAVDTIGIGKGIVDRLMELGKKVIAINSANKANEEEKYYNRRSEMWGYLQTQILNRDVEWIEDEVIRKQICSPRYKVINSNGKIQLEHKDQTKKRLGQSPDRGDCYVYGVWALQEVQGSVKERQVYYKRPVFSGAGGY